MPQWWQPAKYLCDKNTGPQQWFPKSGLLGQALCAGSAARGRELDDRIEDATAMNQKGLGSAKKVQKGEEKAKI